MPAVMLPSLVDAQGQLPTMAAANKCLAQNNKSRTGDKATKRS